MCRTRDVLLRRGSLDLEGHRLGVGVGEAQNLADFVREWA